VRRALYTCGYLLSVPRYNDILVKNRELLKPFIQRPSLVGPRRNFAPIYTREKTKIMGLSDGNKLTIV